MHFFPELKREFMGFHSFDVPEVRMSRYSQGDADDQILRLMQ